MAEDAIDIAGISRATISPDGDKVVLSLVDLENNEYDISLTFERLGMTIVKLLAAAEAAKAQRVADGIDEAEPIRPGPDALLPYPIVRYAVGLSEDGTQAVMRLVSDNDLIWDFILPMEAVQRLRDDLTRLENLPRPAYDTGEDETEDGEG